MHPSYAEALAHVRAGRPGEAAAIVLARWRETRRVRLADLLDRLLALEVADPVYDRPPPEHASVSDEAWAPFLWHPGLATTGPDPRATYPRVARFFGYDEWPAAEAARLAESGDARAVRWLERVTLGRHAAERAALAQRLGAARPAALPIAHEADAISALEAAVHAHDPVGTLGLAVSHGTPAQRAARRAVLLGLTRPDLALLGHGFRFDGARLVWMYVRPRPGVLQALTDHPELPPLEEVGLDTHPAFAADEAPPWWRGPWDPTGTRAAAAALLLQPRLASLTTVRWLPLPLLRLVSRSRPAWERLGCTVGPGDDPGALASVLASFPVLRALEVGGGAPATLAPALAHLPDLEALDVTAGPNDWSAWLAVTPPRAVLRTRARHACTCTFTPTPAGRHLTATLGSNWDSYDNEFEDAPTPAADLVAWLDALPAGALDGVVVESAGELYDEPAALLAALARHGGTLLEE